MPVLTLTTDWNQQDYYTGTVKGKVLTSCPEATVVDISHQIQPFNLSQAAFVLRNSCFHFPPGTVHLIGVQALPEPGKGFLIVRAGGHFFLSADNGIFGLLLHEEPEQVVMIPVNDPPDKSPLEQVLELTGYACKLMKGSDPAILGEVVESFEKRTPMRATIDESVINGSVIYIDSYRNAITNISEELFRRVSRERPYEILVQSNYFKIKTVSKTYSDAPEGEMLALFNSLGLLEIAIHNGNASELLNLKVGSTVRVRFTDRKM